MWLTNLSEFHLKSLIGKTMAVKGVSYNLQTIIVYFLNERVNEKNSQNIYYIKKQEITFTVYQRLSVDHN